MDAMYFVLKGRVLLVLLTPTLALARTQLLE